MHSSATHLVYAPPTLLIRKQNGLTGYSFSTQADHFSPCERSGIKGIPGVLPTPTSLIAKQNRLTGYCLCTQVDTFGPCDKSGIIVTACYFTPAFFVIKDASSVHYILIFW